MLRNTTFPEIRQIDPAFVWTQDGAPGHTAKATLGWLRQAEKGGECGAYLDNWPPASPDLSPLDFWAWGHIETELYHSGKCDHSTVPKLADALRKIANNLDKATVAMACCSFRGRVAHVAANDGKFIQNKEYKKKPEEALAPGEPAAPGLVIEG